MQTLCYFAVSAIALAERVARSRLPLMIYFLT